MNLTLYPNDRHVVTADVNELFVLYGLLNHGKQCSEDADFPNLYEMEREHVTSFVKRVRAGLDAAQLEETSGSSSAGEGGASMGRYELGVTTLELRLMCRLATMALAWVNPIFYQTLTGAYREEAVEVARDICEYADRAQME